MKDKRSTHYLLRDIERRRDIATAKTLAEAQAAWRSEPNNDRIAILRVVTRQTYTYV